MCVWGLYSSGYCVSGVVLFGLECAYLEMIVSCAYTPHKIINLKVLAVFNFIAKHLQLSFPVSLGKQELLI